MKLLLDECIDRFWDVLLIRSSAEIPSFFGVAMFSLVLNGEETGNVNCGKLGF